MRVRLGSGLAVAVVLAVPACASGSTPRAATVPTRAPSVPTRASSVTTPAPTRAGLSACGTQRPVATVTMRVGGRTRTALMAVPATYDGRHRLPVVVGLHGYGTTNSATWFDAYTQLRRVGTSLGAIVLVPQGTGNPIGWNVPNLPVAGPNDVTYLSSLISLVDTRFCGDPTRALVGGWSDGADMAITLACSGRVHVASLLLVSASIGPKAGCAPSRVVQVHGTADPIVAYTGRPPDTRPGFGTLPGVAAEKSFAAWSSIDGCTGRTVRNVRDLRILDATGCAKAPVRLIAVQGGGHVWPGGTPLPYGRTTTSLHTVDLLRMAWPAA